MYDAFQKNGKWYAEVDWGDTIILQFAISNNSVPANLNGNEIILGIKDSDFVILESVGSASDDEVVFTIAYEDMLSARMMPNKRYSFDFWNKTTAFTYIKEGVFSVGSVSHNVGD